jgi:hypothetical protein
MSVIEPIRIVEDVCVDLVTKLLRKSEEVRGDHGVCGLMWYYSPSKKQMPLFTSDANYLIEILVILRALCNDGRSVSVGDIYLSPRRNLSLRTAS